MNGKAVMDYHIASAIVEGRLELILSGQSAVSNAESITREVIETAKEAGQGEVLIDVRDISGRLGLVKTYSLVRGLPERTRGQRIAVVELEENRPNFEFQELTARSAGHQIRFFTDIEKARAWLGGSADGVGG